MTTGAALVAAFTIGVLILVGLGCLVDLMIRGHDGWIGRPRADQPTRRSN